MPHLIQTQTYAERVYAAVLGKVIGVYAGRPFEGWSHERILQELGEINRYVAPELGMPIVVTDDDISGTFTFFRALTDHGYDANLSAAQIGETWLNYLIEGKTVLWWGGMGTSTEHTAYLRLKNGIPAPESGSIARNGRTVAEQIGSQIFIEGWGMVHPGDPVAAADLAARAARVSHDGEAVYGAQVIAALVSLAFVETEMDRMLDSAVACIPADSIIAKMVGEIRSWNAEGLDWYAAFARLKASYGYDRYGGGCHMVPNHGVVVLALLYGGGNFSHSLMIANTCGWDTDCNSANVGCIVGAMHGLAGIDGAYDWRGPVRDRMFLPTADGGRCVTDAVREATEIVRVAHELHRLSYDPPKAGARFSFAFPDSVQGFSATGARLANASGSLEIELAASTAEVKTSTFPSLEERRQGGYTIVASPSLSPGQTVRAQIRGGSGHVSVAIAIGTFEGDDLPREVRAELREIAAGERVTLEFKVPDLGGYPVTNVGLVLQGDTGARVVLDNLTWDGPPEVTLGRTAGGSAWRDAWVSGISEFSAWAEPFRLVQNEGTGLLIYGDREWTDLAVESEMTAYLVEDAGLAVRVQGMRRYYALRVLRDGKAQIIKMKDGLCRILAETQIAWNFDDRIRFHLSVTGNSLRGTLNGTTTLEATDNDEPLTEGAIAFVLTEGRVTSESIAISPA